MIKNLNLKKSFSTSLPYNEDKVKNINSYTKPRDLHNEDGIEYGRHFGK
jgi:hypothetical protein